LPACNRAAPPSPNASRATALTAVDRPRPNAAALLDSGSASRTSMSLTTELLGDCFVVCWDEPTTTDLNTLRREFSAARARHASPLIIVSVHNAARPLPEPETRTALVRGLPDLLSPNESLHLVLLGEGVLASLKRTVMRSMTVLMRRSNITMHSSLGALIDALRARGVSEPVRRSVEELIRAKS
jgi:hypothetical protein